MVALLIYILLGQINCHYCIFLRDEQQGGGGGAGGLYWARIAYKMLVLLIHFGQIYGYKS